MDLAQERRAVAYWMRRLYSRRLTTATGGNVSCRAGSDCFVLTPGGPDKALVRADQVAIVGMDGANRTPGIRPSSEDAMHLRIYQRHPHISAIVHAHPTTAGAFACSETPIDLGLLCETYALVDRPVRVPYARSGTDELADIVAEHAGRSSCLLLQNHAAITTGADLVQAFSRMELLEEAARVTLIARQLDGVAGLTEPQRRELDILVGRAPSRSPA